MHVWRSFSIGAPNIVVDARGDFAIDRVHRGGRSGCVGAGALDVLKSVLMRVGCCEPQIRLCWRTRMLFFEA